MLRRVFIGLGLTLLAASPAAAQDFKKGLGAAQRGDFATALQEWRPLAEQGRPLAQYNLAQLYRLGKGVPQDFVKAMVWYRKAAAQGYAGAQHNLGTMYYKGLGIRRPDYTAAIGWYRKAAAQGYASAQYSLGFMYFRGQGVAKDNVQAHMWFSLSAAKGHKHATDDREKVAQLMTATQIAKAKKLARAWRAKHEKN